MTDDLIFTISYLISLISQTSYGFGGRFRLFYSYSAMLLCYPAIYVYESYYQRVINELLDCWIAGALTLGITRITMIKSDNVKAGKRQQLNDLLTRTRPTSCCQARLTN